MQPKASQSKLDGVYELLEERIRTKVWPIGSQIPTEVELSTALGCSRSTVGKAIAQLVHAGLVERRTKAGTRVIRDTPFTPRPEIDLDAFAFIYPSDQHEGIWRTLKGFQDAGRKAGRRVVMLPSGTDYEKEMELVDQLSEFAVKGAVVFPLLPTPEAVLKFSQTLISSKLPIVLTEVNLPAIGCPTVVVDAFHAAHTMTRHLISRGLRKIGFLANYANIPAVTEEYRGYLWALEEAGLSAPAGGVLLDPSVNPDFDNPLIESTALGHRLLESANGSLDAAVCANDYLALGCIQAASERGLTVPGSLAVASCNDYGLTGPGGLALTTYRIPREQIGRRCFELLDQIVSGRPIPHHEATVRGALVTGQSCG